MLYLTTDLVRSYSLTEALRPNRYTLAIQLAQNSRGGSQWVHDHLNVNDPIRLSPPANLFPLQSSAGTSLLLAGGIGLTPLLAMAWELHHQQKEFELHICVREAHRMPFHMEYRQWPFAEKVYVYVDDQVSQKKLAIPELLDKQNKNVQIYTCGPAGFMKMVRSTAVNHGVPDSQIHQEHFGAEIDSSGETFTLVCVKSNKTLPIPLDKTILQVLTEAGIKVPTSCQQGVCGSCLTTVIKGTPEHRDMVQTESEKAMNTKIAVCCSRSLTKTLEIDL